MLSKIASLISSLRDSLHLAVPARSTTRRMPGYRPMGRSLVPYHYMQPAPVPVCQKQLPR